MICGGDEIGRTKLGNNNTYCQDNEISWYKWKNMDGDFCEFVINLINLRKEHPVFHRRNWFQAKLAEMEDIGWYRPDGNIMREKDWGIETKFLAVFLRGHLGYNDSVGEPIIDNDFYVIFNASANKIEFILNCPDENELWEKIIDTIENKTPEKQIYKRDHKITINPHSIMVFKHIDAADG